MSLFSSFHFAQLILPYRGVKGTTFETNGILNTNYAYVRQYNILSEMVQQVLINGVEPADAAKAAQQNFEDILADLE